MFKSAIELHHGDMYILGPEDDKEYHHKLKPLKITGDRFDYRTAVIFRLLQKYTYVNKVTGRELVTKKPKIIVSSAADAKNSLGERRSKRQAIVRKAGRTPVNAKHLPRRII